LQKVNQTLPLAPKSTEVETYDMNGRVYTNLEPGKYLITLSCAAKSDSIYGIKNLPFILKCIAPNIEVKLAKYKFLVDEFFFGNSYTVFAFKIA
jgi:hypothetical protein